MKTGPMKEYILARAERKRLWSLMCAHDGVAEDCMFFAPSDGNPHTAAYDRAMGAELRAQGALREWRANVS
jgi:hypothetical protein